MLSGQAIADRWLARLLRTYPSQAARFMAHESDPMLNPVGQSYRQLLGVLVVELLGGMNPARVRKALDALMQICAVSDSTPSASLSFIFELKEILREDCPASTLGPLEDRIDKMALEAFGLYMENREKMYEARNNEVRRRWSVFERVLSRSERAERCERGVS